MKELLYKIISFTGMAIIISSSSSNIALAQFWEDESWIIEWITRILGTKNWPSSALLDTVRSTINWILGILATVALVICIYAWFKMLTSWGDSKGFDSWLKTLKNAALWLAIIWLSWLIVSAIIWFINLQWWEMV